LTVDDPVLATGAATACPFLSIDARLILTSTAGRLVDSTWIDSLRLWPGIPSKVERCSPSSASPKMAIEPLRAFVGELLAIPVRREEDLVDRGTTAGSLSDLRLADTDARLSCFVTDVVSLEDAKEFVLDWRLCDRGVVSGIGMPIRSIAAFDIRTSTGIGGTAGVGR